MCKTTHLPHRNQDVKPDRLVAIDFKKAFDTVTHEAVTDAARVAGLTGHPVNFMKGFLERRASEVRMQGPVTRRYSNAVGVPQAAILSTTLFNISMAHLAWQFEEVHKLEFIIDAGDIAPRTPCKGEVTDQVAAVQTALDMTTAFLAKTATSPSLEKTAYINIGGHGERRHKVALDFVGTRIHRVTEG